MKKRKFYPYREEDADPLSMLERLRDSGKLILKIPNFGKQNYAEFNEPEPPMPNDFLIDLTRPPKD